MGVRKKEILEREGDPVAHHLALRTFATIEQKRLSLPNDGERGDPPLDGGAGGGGTQKADEERHARI